MGRCKLFKQGPDDRSTYPECWGAEGKSPGRLVAEADGLAGLAEAAAQLGHENWTVQDGDRWLRPEEFWQDVPAAENDPEDGLVCCCRVQVDLSGVGHCWQDRDADDLPADVRQEIEGEIIDGRKDECDDFIASNGMHYRWR